MYARTDQWYCVVQLTGPPKVRRCIPRFRMTFPQLSSSHLVNSGVDIGSLVVPYCQRQKVLASGRVLLINPVISSISHAKEKTISRHLSALWFIQRWRSKWKDYQRPHAGFPTAGGDEDQTLELRYSAVASPRLLAFQAQQSSQHIRKKMVAILIMYRLANLPCTYMAVYFQPSMATLNIEAFQRGIESLTSLDQAYL